MSDDEQVAILAAQYLKQIFRSNGLIPLKVEILLPAHSMNSVRATYKAWLVDPSLDDSFDDPRPTIHWEVGVAHFFREGDHHGTARLYRPRRRHRRSGSGDHSVAGLKPPQATPSPSSGGWAISSA